MKDASASLTALISFVKRRISGSLGYCCCLQSSLSRSARSVFTIALLMFQFPFCSPEAFPFKTVISSIVYSCISYRGMLFGLGTIWIEFIYFRFPLCILYTLFQSQEGYNMPLIGYTFTIGLSAPVIPTLKGFVYCRQSIFLGMDASSSNLLPSVWDVLKTTSFLLI